MPATWTANERNPPGPDHQHPPSLKNINHRNPLLRNGGTWVAIVIISLLILRTIIRNVDWYNGIALYSHDLQYKQNDRIENLLAMELVAAKKLPEAKKHFETLLTRNPNEVAVIVNLCHVYEVTGNISKAENTCLHGLKADDTGVI